MNRRNKVRIIAVVACLTLVSLSQVPQVKHLGYKLFGPLPVWKSKGYAMSSWPSSTDMACTPVVEKRSDGSVAILAEFAWPVLCSSDGKLGGPCCSTIVSDETKLMQAGNWCKQKSVPDRDRKKWEFVLPAGPIPDRGYFKISWPYHGSPGSDQRGFNYDASKGVIVLSPVPYADSWKMPSRKRPCALGAVGFARNRDDVTVIIKLYERANRVRMYVNSLESYAANQPFPKLWLMEGYKETDFMDWAQPDLRSYWAALDEWLWYATIPLGIFDQIGSPDVVVRVEADQKSGTLVEEYFVGESGAGVVKLEGPATCREKIAAAEKEEAERRKKEK